MSARRSLVKEAIIPFYGMAIIGFVTAFIIAAQYAADNIVADLSLEVEDAECSVVSVDKGEPGAFFGTDPSMMIDCSGAVYKIEDTTLVVEYLQQDARPSLICSIDGLDNADCTLPE